MRKYLNIYRGHAIDRRYVELEVLTGPHQLNVMAGGCISTEDLADLDTPARLVSRMTIGFEDIDLVNDLKAAFTQILKKPPGVISRLFGGVVAPKDLTLVKVTYR